MALRTALIAVSILLLACVAFLFLKGFAVPGFWMAGLWAVLLAAGVIFERRYYTRALDEPPQGEGWEVTDERFIDPETGKQTVVYYNASTGKRAYVKGPPH
jgi:hypothetical protein